MKYAIHFRDDVFAEIVSIYKWYENQSKGLGSLFIEELEFCFDNIRSNPFLFEKKYKNFRQVVTKKFPYLVIFEVEGNSIIIYHIIHTRRNPDLKFKR